MKDIGNLRDNAAFITKVSKGVCWVPVSALGKTRYQNSEIEKFIPLSPEEKLDKINNLYEAIQLFQLSDFKGVFDNTDHIIRQTDSETILWQTHKTGRDAVATNEGCCATDTNWLSYLLYGKYDEMGCLCWANRDGNGHITTYIHHNEYYYFIDMMMCRPDSQRYGCIENGELASLSAAETGGCLFKCETPQQYIKYLVDIAARKNRDIPFAFYLRNCKEATATGSRKNGDVTTFLIPFCDDPVLIYKESDPKSDIVFTAPPRF